MSTHPSNINPVVVDGSSSTAAKRVVNGRHVFNPFAADFTPASPIVAHGIDAASNATTAVASANEAHIEPSPTEEAVASSADTTAVTSPIQPIASMATVPRPAAEHVNTTTTHNWDTAPSPTPPRTLPVPPFDIHLYEPNRTRLKSSPWYSPICTPECNMCHENAVGGLTPCQIRLHAPAPPAGVKWNKLFHDNNEASIYIAENEDYMPWWTRAHHAVSPPQSRTEGKKDVAALTNTETERSARCNARMAVLVHKELVYLRSMAVGNGEYISLVLKDPEWYPGVKCPIVMELSNGGRGAGLDTLGLNRFERFDKGESEREIMEDIMVHRRILRDRRVVGSPELSGKEVDAVEGKLRKLGEMLDAEIDWEERRSDAWWNGEPFYEKRRLMRVRAEDRPVGKAFGAYIYSSKGVNAGSVSAS